MQSGEKQNVLEVHQGWVLGGLMVSPVACLASSSTTSSKSSSTNQASSRSLSSRFAIYLTSIELIDDVAKLSKLLSSGVLTFDQSVVALPLSISSLSG